jgi:hypothetical protein
MSPRATGKDHPILDEMRTMAHVVSHVAAGRATVVSRVMGSDSDGVVRGQDLRVLPPPFATYTAGREADLPRVDPPGMGPEWLVEGNFNSLRWR